MARMPKARKVVHEPNAVLRTVSEAVAIERIKSADIQDLIEDMKVTMKVENGVGIAAPQVGVNLRIFIAETDDGPKAFINPEFLEKSYKIIDYQEGCLSVPGKGKPKTRLWGYTKRHRTVTVKALDENGLEFITKGQGLLAIILQHENDHLDGVLFIDHATDLQQG